MTTKHTPTPWHITTDQRAQKTCEKGSMGIETKDEIVAFVGCSPCLGSDSRLTEVNAAHIVHCVNSHDQLVEALAALVRTAHGGDGGFPLAKAQAQAALKAVGEEA